MWVWITICNTVREPFAGPDMLVSPFTFFLFLPLLFIGATCAIQHPLGRRRASALPALAVARPQPAAAPPPVPHWSRPHSTALASVPPTSRGGAPLLRPLCAASVAPAPPLVAPPRALLALRRDAAPPAMLARPLTTPAPPHASPRPR